MKKFLLIIFSLTLLTGCDFIQNTIAYQSKAKQFLKALIEEDFQKCIDLTAKQNKHANSNRRKDSLRKVLSNARNLVVKNFGDSLEFSFIKSNASWSWSFPPGHTNDSTSNTTVLLIQVSNNTHFGVLKVLFDNKTDKILNIRLLNIKQHIPDMTFFWFIGIFALCIPAFNIYIIRLIRKSNYKKKWPKYISVVILNIPTISYKAIGGISLKLFKFQFLLGIGFTFFGYFGAAWTIGIPLAGLFWFWKIKLRATASL